MEKFLFLVLLGVFVLTTAFSNVENVKAASEPSDVIPNQISGSKADLALKKVENFLDAANSVDHEFDLEQLVKQEVEVLDEDGTYLGVIGVEPVNSGISLLSTVPNGTSTWKIYWYGVGVNYEYRINISVNSSTGLATITRIYDMWSLVLPPLTIVSENIQILRAKETSTLPASVQYTARLSTIYGGSIYNYAWAEIANKKLRTGTN